MINLSVDISNVLTTQTKQQILLKLLESCNKCEDVIAPEDMWL